MTIAVITNTFPITVTRINNDRRIVRITAVTFISNPLDSLSLGNEEEAGEEEDEKVEMLRLLLDGETRCSGRDDVMLWKGTFAYWISIGNLQKSKQ